MNNYIVRKDGGVEISYNGKIKIFKKKPIYLPDEYAVAFSNHLAGKNTYIIGMNGYSSLTPEDCRNYGIQHGSYEVACASFLNNLIMFLQEKFKGINIRLVHGASNLGVDKSTISVGQRLSLGQLGFNCLEYMFYVEDDDVPVYVAKNKDDYCDAFTGSLNLLIGANGRKMAFDMDIYAVFKKIKDVIPVNIIKAISATGGPSALDKDGNINDAVALFYERMHSVNLSETNITDSWNVVNNRVQNIVANLCRTRGTLSPSLSFDYIFGS